MRLSMMIAVCVALVLTGTAEATVPASITAQGKLTDTSGTPLAPGSKSFSFRIFDAPSLGVQLWPAGGVGEVQNLTTDAAGLWVGLIGAVSPLTDAVFADSLRWLEVTVSGTTLPRVRLTTGPFAFRVATVDGATGGQISGMVTTGGVAEGLRIKGPGVGSANEAYLRFTDQAGTSTGYVGDAHPGNSDIYLLSSTGGVTLYTLAGSTLLAQADGDVAMGMNGQVVIAPSTLSLGDVGRLNVGDNATNATTAFIGAYGTGGEALHVYTTGFAGQRAAGFQGDVSISGTLSKSAGSFQIDHPLDPANKYLYHSFVESPDMMNIYNGNATLDSNGEAVIELPKWFGALNKDFRYQLTAIGGPGPDLYVAHEIVDNQFRIAGGANGMRVSWQVTGVRQDAYANAHRIPIEQAKSETERGFYLHPELFSQPEGKNIEWARHPEMMNEMKEQREKAKARSEKQSAAELLLR